MARSVTRYNQEVNKYLWEPRRKSLKTKVIILLVLSVSFMPISYLWYDALSDLDCKKSGQNQVVVDPNTMHNVCMSNAGSHWVIFYGVNAMIYGMPLAMILKSTRNRSEDL